MNHLSSLGSRYVFLDCAKCFGIFLICLGHFLESDSFLKVAIYSFHVPLFFLISGFLCKPCDFGKLIKKDFLRILLPYLAFFFISYPLSSVMSDKPGVIWREFFMVLGENVWNEPLWFLPVIFICHILFVSLLNIVGEKRSKAFAFLLMIICLVAAIFILNAENFPNLLGSNKIPLMMAYLCLGFLIRGLIHKKAAPLWTLIFIAFFLLAGYINAGDNISVMNCDYNNIAVYIPFAAVGTVSFIGMFAAAKPLGLVTLISKNTIFYMGFHYFLMKPWQKNFDHSLILDLLGGIIVFLLITAICLLYSKLCKRFNSKVLIGTGKLFGLYA